MRSVPRASALIPLALAASLGASLHAHAVPIIYTASLSGSAESPPNGSPGTGSATLELDLAAHTMRVTATFTGLTGSTTMAHIHAPTPVPFDMTAGVATQVPNFAAFPVGVTSGMYDMTFDTLDAASWNPAYLTANGGTAAGAEAAFAAHVAGGLAYLNIHTSTFGGGEIRGFFIPSPGASVTLALACGLLASRRRRVAPIA